MQFTKIDPPVPGSACSTCFGIGTDFGNRFTPDYLSVVVSGIRKGAAWGVDDGEPGNGNWKLPQTGPCSYAASLGLYDVTLQWNSASTIMDVNYDVTTQFHDSAASICLLDSVSNLIDSAQAFWNGKFQIHL